MLARNHAARLHRITVLVSKLRSPKRFLLTTQEWIAFAQPLANDILATASGSDRNGEYLKRYDQLGELDRLAVRDLVLGLCRLGYFEPESKRMVLEEWWATCPK